MAAKVRSLDSEKSSLDGHFLVAMPGMEDGRFARSVVYICAHSADGAMGIMINQPAPRLSFPDLLVQLGVITQGEQIQLPPDARKMRVHRGGPVETGRGFILHSSDYFVANSTLPIDDNVSLTATLEILKAIALGLGPESAILALGYAGWAPGQLESEIQANGWLSVPASPEIIFDEPLDTRYQRALAAAGIDPGRLSSIAGHA